MMAVWFKDEAWEVKGKPFFVFWRGAFLTDKRTPSMDDPETDDFRQTRGRH